ncbi:MAG: trehalose 6-phosphate phosphatase [Candidatus Sumerlaeota bacterium]|nr:trehalose 6-phosphate phosphatase [Candidatus Sumerlaeota bacterium]
MLDYDGTLAPFRVERNEAVPYEGIRPLLDRIMAETPTRVAVISGRACADLVPLLGLRRTPEIFGGHGWEHRLPDGTTEAFPLGDGARAAIDAAAQWIAAHGLQARSERKAASVTLHWRGMEEKDARHLAKSADDAWGPLAEAPGVELHAFDGGVELRALGRNKGDSVRTVLSTLPEGTPVAFLGDDLTDEDAFEALQDKGLRVLVRGEFRETAADVWLTPPSELIGFLTQWLESTGAGRSVRANLAIQEP